MADLDETNSSKQGRLRTIAKFLIEIKFEFLIIDFATSVIFTEFTASLSSFCQVQTEFKTRSSFSRSSLSSGMFEFGLAANNEFWVEALTRRKL